MNKHFVPDKTKTTHAHRLSFGNLPHLSVRSNKVPTRRRLRISRYNGDIAHPPAGFPGTIFPCVAGIVMFSLRLPEYDMKKAIRCFNTRMTSTNFPTSSKYGRI